MARGPLNIFEQLLSFEDLVEDIALVAASAALP